MKLLLPALFFSSLGMTLRPHAQTAVQASLTSAPKTSAATTTVSVIPELAIPLSLQKHSTVIGGEIKYVDPVRDQLSLKVFGGKTVKIVFDERTQVYRDGQRIRVIDLKAEDHASIQTTLDGPVVFALKIHTLSQMPEGETLGQVTSFSAQTGDLTMKAALSQQGLTLHLPTSTPIVRVGQMASGSQLGSLRDLTKGALIDVKFKGTDSGQATVTLVHVVAVPGSAFTFRGNLANLDARSGRLVILDPSDNETYPITFDVAHLPADKDLKVGSPVTAVTRFDGTKYIATEISTQ